MSRWFWQPLLLPLLNTGTIMATSQFFIIVFVPLPPTGLKSHHHRAHRAGSSQLWSCRFIDFPQIYNPCYILRRRSRNLNLLILFSDLMLFVTHCMGGVQEFGELLYPSHHNLTAMDDQLVLLVPITLYSHGFSFRVHFITQYSSLWLSTKLSSNIRQIILRMILTSVPLLGGPWCTER